MLVLFETPAGYSLFKLRDDGKILDTPDDIQKEFVTPEGANKLCAFFLLPAAHLRERSQEPIP